MTPVFQTVLHDEKNRGNCLRASLASIFDLGIDDIPCFELMERREWRDEFKFWLLGLGFGFTELFEQPVRGDYYLALGRTCRGTDHCVILFRGKMVHDPHPSQDGLISNVKFWCFNPV